MKKLFLLTALLYAGATFAQVGRISLAIDNLLRREVVFHSFDLWARSDENGPVKELRRSTHANLSLSALSQINQSRPKTLKISFPFHDETIQVLLYQEDVLTPDCQFRTPEGTYQHYKKGAYYRGIIAGDPSSVAAFSIFDKEVIAVVSSPKYGDINLSKNTKGNEQDYLIYSARDQLEPKSFNCMFDEKRALTDANLRSGKSATETTKCVRLYYELLYEVFANKGYDLDQTLNWLTALHNNVATVFANDGINHVVLSDSFIWTSPDNFQLGSPYDYLLQFMDRRPAFNADIACLLLHSSGSGISNGVNTGCQANHAIYTPAAGPYLATDTDSQIANYPLYSNSVQLAAHEIGHALGSPHTHQCVWNGNGTQIDDCGNLSSIFGGPQPCYNPDAPIIPADINGVTQGTIMSYCPFNSLAAGFGPQPRQLIIDRVESKPCFGTDCVNSCWPSIERLNLSTLGFTSAKLTIVDQNPNANSWWVRVIPGEFQLVTTNPYILENLPEKSEINVEVKQICSEPFSAVYTTTDTFRTSGDYCDSVIYDYDDATNEVSSGYPYQTTLFPHNDQERISLQMDYITVNVNTDHIKIFNGPNTTDPIMADFTGYDPNPGTFLSTHPTGALTIRFENDGIHWWGQGFQGHVACIAAPLQNEDFSFSNLKVYPNPAHQNITLESPSDITSITLIDMLGRIIEKKTIHQRKLDYDLSDLSNGVYIIDCESNNQRSLIRIVKE